MLLYHGSKVIVESPEIRIQRYNKDFYFGFYCTLFPEQAVRWATRFDGVGYLNEYLYTPNERLKVKRFPEMTEEWLDFIVQCRLGNPHDYDIVEGPMANDTIFNYVQTMYRTLWTGRSAGRHFGRWQSSNIPPTRSAFIRPAH